MSENIPLTARRNPQLAKENADAKAFEAWSKQRDLGEMVKNQALNSQRNAEKLRPTV